MSALATVGKADELVQKVNANVAQAQALKVTSPQTRVQAVDFLKGIKALRTEAEEHHRPIIDAAHKTHKAACDALNRIDKPLADAERIVKGQVGGYDMEQDRIRREAERAAQEAARRQAEEEALALAQRAIDEGATQAEAEAVLVEEMSAPLVVAPPPPLVENKSGVGTRYNYRVNVQSFAQLVKFVAENPMFINLLKPDESALGALARAQKESFAIPGCQLIKEPVVSVR